MEQWVHSSGPCSVALPSCTMAKLCHSLWQPGKQQAAGPPSCPTAHSSGHTALLVLGCLRDWLARLPHGQPRSCGAPLGFCCLLGWEGSWQQTTARTVFLSCFLGADSPLGAPSPCKLSLFSKCGLKQGVQALGLAWEQPLFQPRHLQADPGGARRWVEPRNHLSQSHTEQTHCTSSVLLPPDHMGPK